MTDTESLLTLKSMSKALNEQRDELELLAPTLDPKIETAFVIADFDLLIDGVDTLERDVERIQKPLET